MSNDFQLPSSRQFDDPFLLPSSDAMPKTLQTALDFAVFLYYLNPNYQMASARVMRHFITDFDYPGEDASKDEKDDLDEFLHYTLQLPLFMTEVGDEYAAYGNAFVRIHFPFDRFLIDPRTGTPYSLDFFGDQAKYVSDRLEYEVPDPHDRKRRICMKFRDHKSMDVSRIKLRRLAPQQMYLLHNRISGTSKFCYRFEADLIADVEKGRLHIVNELPIDMLAAIRNKEDFKFADDTIFHFRAPTVSGVSNHGWGMPPTLANYRNLHQLQVYRKLDEAVGMDYMLPFRIFTPMPQSSPQEVMDNLLLGRWTEDISTIIANRRKDKFAIHSLPFPVSFQEFGYNGKELAPKDVMEYQTQSLFDGMGYPQELFKGSLQYLQMPNALRMFENSFMFVHMGYNSLLQWTVRRVRQWLNLPKVKVMLQRPTLADSIERKQMVFQLATMGEISRETGYHSLGIDNIPGEFKKRMEEDAELERQRAKTQMDLQRELQTGSIQATEQTQQAGASQGSLPGGGPSPGGPMTTPMDSMNDAQALAEYWLKLPLGDRRNAMMATQSSKPDLHAMAKQKMEELRRSGETQGRESVNQQFQQGGGGGGMQQPGGGGAGM